MDQIELKFKLSANKWPFQAQPLWVRVDLGAMAVKGYAAFPKAPALLKPDHQIVKCHIRDTRWGILPLCKHKRYAKDKRVSIEHNEQCLAAVVVAAIRTPWIFASGKYSFFFLWRRVFLYSNFNLLHNYQCITFPTQSPLLLYSSVRWCYFPRQQISSSLQDSPQYSGQYLLCSILDGLCTPPFSSSSSSIIKPLGIVSSASITTGISVAFIFHNFFSYLASSKYFSLFSFSLIFSLWYAVIIKFTIRLVLFLFFFFLIYLFIYLFFVNNHKV